MINYINSKDNKIIKYAYSLKMSKTRKEEKKFLCEGIKALELALRSDLVKDVFTLKELNHLPSNVNQYIVNEMIIEKLSSMNNPEGIVFTSEMKENVLPTKRNKIIYLDNISDPGNMGTIIRTALAFDYDLVAVSPNSVDIYNEKVIAASKGAIFLMPIYKGELIDLKEGHQLIVSALKDNATDLNKVIPNERFILVVGNEAHGVREEIIHQADIVTKIPIKNIDSLNAAIASSILMCYFKKG